MINKHFVLVDVIVCFCCQILISVLLLLLLLLLSLLLLLLCKGIVSCIQIFVSKVTVISNTADKHRCEANQEALT